MYYASKFLVSKVKILDEFICNYGHWASLDWNYEVVFMGTVAQQCCNTNLEVHIRIVPSNGGNGG